MPRLRIAILDDDSQITDTIAEYLRGTGCHEIVGTASDGGSGLELIRSHVVDVAVIDLMMPGRDGFYVLEELSRQPDRPICVVLSGISREYVARMAFEKGADYYILKPFDLELLRKRIDELGERKKQLVQPLTPPVETTPERFVLRLLHEIPIPNTLNGYEYLKLAILSTIEDGSLSDGITKRLYPTVGKKYKATGQQVERAIRHALDTAWQRGGGRSYARLMGYGSPDGAKPTNGAFISAAVELYHQGRTSSVGSNGVT